ncbi:MULTISPECIES: hypothetical protein [unclassified Sphingobacterium]|uniref:hypothetical protein n=1 Tax=unclassified Sphingobacterium TaxID=2609468 RepID=UPI0025EB9BE7|nr:MULTISPECIES: hypothetical protein [unclassified Sphingobacterium]
MVHLFNALIILLFLSTVALFSNLEKKKNNEGFPAVSNIYRTDSVPTVDLKYLGDFTANKQ